MDDESKNLIKQQLASLPHDVKEAIGSNKVGEHILAIARAHKLHVDTTAQFGEAVYYMLLGLMHSKEFMHTLQQDLGFSKTEAESVASSVDLQILSPIRQSLMKMQKAMDEADRAEEAGIKPKQEILTTAAGNSIPIPSKLIEDIQQAPAHAGPIPHIRTMPIDIAKIKMGESIRLPKEELAINYSADPYREKPE